MERLSLHHPAFVVGDLAPMLEFYGKLGFAKSFEWTAEDGSLTIILLDNGAATVELFLPVRIEAVSNTQPALDADLKIPGIRHVAFSTQDMDGLLASLKDAAIEAAVPPRVGRTGRRIAFINDPEGNWIEFVEQR